VTYDNYNPRKFRTGQTSDEYYIHAQGGWTDRKVRAFRRQVRQHNIWVRYAKAKGEGYNRDMERWGEIRNTFKFFGLDRPPRYERIRSSPVWLRRVGLMKRLKNYLKAHRMLSVSLRGLSRRALDEMLIETCKLLGVQID